jgi:acyl-homoserine lactone acylase PvdQ
LRAEPPNNRGAIVSRCEYARRAAAVLGLLVLPAAAGAQAPDLAAQVEIRRTAYGVPHILADNMRAAGYALGWVQLEDYGQVVAYGLFRNRGELASVLDTTLEADFVNRPGGCAP